MRTLSPVEIAMVRKRLGMSQATFAKTFQLNFRTIRAWETGQNTPSGAAAVLLWLLNEIPEEILRALRKP